MREYKHKGMLKAVVGDLISNTVLYDHETGEPLNLEEVDAEYKRTIGEIDEVYTKAKAYDDIRYAMEMQTAIGVSDEDTLIDIEHVIVSLIERREGGGSDD